MECLPPRLRMDGHAMGGWPAGGCVENEGRKSRAGRRARAFAADLTRHATALLRQNRPGPHAQHHTPGSQSLSRPSAPALFFYRHSVLTLAPFPPPPPRQDPDPSSVSSSGLRLHLVIPTTTTTRKQLGLLLFSPTVAGRSGSQGWVAAVQVERAVKLGAAVGSERATHRHQLPERGG
jgi:hypothetical protein